MWANRAVAKQKMRVYREQKVKAGLCECCLRKRVTSRYCVLHQQRHLTRVKRAGQQRIARRLREGKCIMCEAVRADGDRRYCQRHREWFRAYHRNWHRARKYTRALAAPGAFSIPVCVRCHGLLVSGYDDCDGYRLFVYRCVNCGHRQAEHLEQRAPARGSV
jgi:hypothetical protein